MPAIVLATCNAWPELSAGDAPLARALMERHGAEIRTARWNAAEDQPLFAGADIVVLRSNWDYHHAPAAFAAWLGWLEAQGTPVFNRPTLVRWNLEKRYLLELAAHGANVPRTLVVENEPAAIRAAVASFGGAPVVLKPAVGASGHHVYRATPDRLDAVIAELHAGVPERRLLAQEFVPEIREGERACVFIDGAFTHAFLRQPDTSRRLEHDPDEPEFRANSQHGVRVSLIESLPPDQIAQARAVLDLLPELPLYARVDGVFRAGRLILTELELNEPSLRLDLCPPAAERFADAVMARLHSGGR
jgi:glutathione synthase/RimK-type ligase-like ATP-grasp enzyme